MNRIKITDIGHEIFKKCAGSSTSYVGVILYVWSYTKEEIEQFKERTGIPEERIQITENGNIWIKPEDDEYGEKTTNRISS